MINEIIVMGRIANDLEPILVGGNSDKLVLRFSIAVNTNKDKAEFYPVECWNKVALNILEYAKKGTLVLIKGRLQQDRFVGKDGHNKSLLKINANYVKILSPKKLEEE